MPSPFPGMNPYLEHEDVFHGFHQRLIVEISNVLVPLIRPDYIADTDVSVYIHELSGDERLLGRPAVDVVEVPFVKIMDRQKRQVVTVIELLSRTKKLKADDRAAYIAKRKNLQRSEVHFIEIDLLRAGEPMPPTNQPDADYRVVLSRYEQRPEVSLWPLRLRDRLPPVPVPLRAPHSDVSLDLQDALDRVYDLGGYGDYIYGLAPMPPLHPEDARWAERIISEASAKTQT
jgi:hypothetical protein